MAHCHADSAVDEFRCLTMESISGSRRFPHTRVRWVTPAISAIISLIGRFDGSMHAGDVPPDVSRQCGRIPRQNIRQIVADHHHGPAFGAQSRICEHFRRLHHRQCGGRFVSRISCGSFEQRCALMATVWRWPTDKDAIGEPTRIAELRVFQHGTGTSSSNRHRVCQSD